MEGIGMGSKFLLLDSAFNMVLNINLGKDLRKKELKKIEDYAKGLIYLSDNQKKQLMAVIEAFDYELGREAVNEECIGGYHKFLKEILSINHSLKGPKCVVYGDNWLTGEVKDKMRRNNFCVFDWRSLNPAYIDEYDLYILCDEPLKIYDLPAIEDKEKILKIWDYLKYKYVVFPSFYEVYMKYKRKCDPKVKGIVTGGTNVKSAVRSRLLHTKAISLANTGQDIFYDFRMFCHAHEAMPDIKYAIIGLAPYSLRYDASKSKVEWRRCLAYYPIVKTMHNCEDAELFADLYESEDKKIRHYFDEADMDKWYEVFEKSIKNETEDVMDVFDESTCSKETLGLNQREISELYNRPFTDVLLENKVLLEGYARFCKGKAIQAIFFLPPYTKWYKEHMQRSYYEELSAFVRELCKKYGAEFVDMMDVTLPDCCFSDYANVNNVGTMKAASYINEIIDR